MQDLLCCSLHRQLYSLVPHSLHFFDSILLPVNDFLSFLDNPIGFSLEEVVDCVLCFNALGALHNTRWNCLPELLLKVRLRFIWFSLLRFGRWICRFEKHFSKGFIRLREMEWSGIWCFTRDIKEVFSWLVEVRCVLLCAICRWLSCSPKDRALCGLNFRDVKRGVGVDTFRDWVFPLYPTGGADTRWVDLLTDTHLLPAGDLVYAWQISNERLEIVPCLLLLVLLDGQDICILISIWRYRPLLFADLGPIEDGEGCMVACILGLRASPLTESDQVIMESQHVGYHKQID